MQKLLSFVAPLSLVFLLSAKRTLAEEPKPTLAEIGNAYAAHRKGFDPIDCRFEYKSTEAANLDDALQGHFVGTPIVQSGHWLVDGPAVRYELRCTPDLILDAQKKMAAAAVSADSNSVPIRCSETYYLRNGVFSLRYGPLLHGANLFGPGDKDGAGIRVTPFNLDFMGSDEFSSPDRYLQDCQSGRFKGEVTGMETIHGINALVVTLDYGRGVMKFGFDPQRNYMLVYQSDARKANEPMYEVFVTDVKECSKKRWFPTRTIVVSKNNPKSNAPLHVRELRVSSLDVDSKPKGDRFQLTLAGGTQVNVIGRTEWTYIKKTASFGLSDLANLNERCGETGRAYEFRSDPFGSIVKRIMPSGSDSHAVTMWFYGGAFFLLVVGTYFVYRVAFARRPDAE